MTNLSQIVVQIAAARHEFKSSIFFRFQVHISTETGVTLATESNLLQIRVWSVKPSSIWRQYVSLEEVESLSSDKTAFKVKAMSYLVEG